MKTTNTLSLVLLCALFYNNADGRKMTCFCDMRSGPHANSPRLMDLHNDVVRGFWKGCKSGVRECKPACHRRLKAAVQNVETISHICKGRGNVNVGIPLIGYLVTSNCRTVHTFNSNKKLCCFHISQLLPNGQTLSRDIGYFC